MKKKLSLPSFLRALFNILYLLTAILGALGALYISIGGITALGRNGDGRLILPVLYDLALTVPDEGVLALAGSAHARDVEVTDIVTSIEVNVLSQDPELAAIARWTILPQFAVLMVGALFSFRLLRDLCGRIALGEVLTEENLRAIRKIGFLCASCSLFDFFAHACSLHFLGGYLARHATLSGINAKFDASLSALPPIPDGLIEGLFILVLAEAFRQGLALKQEADLTV